MREREKGRIIQMMKVKRVSTRRRYRSRPRSMQERIVYLVASHLSESYYGCKSLAELRKRFKTLGANDKFWDSLKAIEAATKNLGSLRLIE